MIWNFDNLVKTRAWEETERQKSEESSKGDAGKNWSKMVGESIQVPFGFLGYGVDDDKFTLIFYFFCYYNTLLNA